MPFIVFILMKCKMTKMENHFLFFFFAYHNNYLSGMARLPGIIIFTIVLIIVINLGRVPGFHDVIVDMGTLNGLSEIDQSFSIQQIATQGLGWSSWIFSL
jgi:hypothetical protein